MPPSVMKVIGNPGTGKTKYLVDHTASLINQGILPEQIAYLTFTRKACGEAMERLISLTGQQRDAFKWVRTLHGLAFTLLGVTKEQMITDADMRMFLGAVGVDDMEGRELLQMHTYARVVGVPLMQAWERLQGSHPVQWTKLLEYDRIYTTFKENRGRYDFYDLLERFLADPVVPYLHTVIVDEAQDLSPIQWSIIKILSEKARVLLLAGDPHQAIYGWCGADSNILLSIDGEEIILPRSNRIPAVVQQVSQRILKKFADPDRYPYEPAGHEGSVVSLPILNMPGLPLNDGTWMFLARNEVFLEDVRSFLYLKGIPFESRGQQHKNHGNEKMLRHIEWYEQWLRTGEISTGRLDKLKTICSHPERAAAMNLPWQEAFDSLPMVERRFYQNNKTGDASRVILSTIHGSKGGEADNVVIFGDYTQAVAKSFQRAPDQEWACLYVGVTRAKKNLYLITPERELGYNWRMFL